jgi:hypothetical protein
MKIEERQSQNKRPITITNIIIPSLKPYQFKRVGSLFPLSDALLNTRQTQVVIQQPSPACHYDCMLFPQMAMTQNPSTA